MRLANCIFAALSALCALSGTRLYGREVWAVVAPARLDSRITHQLKELAAQRSAELRTSRSLTRVAPEQPELLIELREEKDLASFRRVLKSEGGTLPMDVRPELAREGYLLEIDYGESSTPHRVRLTAAGNAGFHHGLLRLPEVLRLPAARLSTGLMPGVKSIRLEKEGARAAIADFPSFPERGIVEGFYGTPWTQKDRLNILRFEGRHGLNVYYYAPKDDPYHRKLWRKPYPPARMKRLGALVEAAKANFVDLCFAISPGLSMVYSSREDFSILARKLDSIGKLGVSCFALFLDDVPPELEHPRDRSRFKTLAEAHVDLINRLDHHLKSRSPTLRLAAQGGERSRTANRLVVTPTVYTNNWGSRDYIRELGAGTNPDVAIVWTGPKVLSPEITVEQAREWGKLLQRKPLVWDNFPVNDGTPWRLNLGPLRRRDPNLPVAVAGLISNPMIQAQASMIPLETAADYLWESQHYDADRAHQKAVLEQYGPEAPALLAPFLRIYGDYLWQENVFRPLFVQERRVIDLGEIDRQLGQLETALETLREHKQLQELLGELAPFPPKTRERLGRIRADLAFAHLPTDKLRWRDDDDVLYASHVSAPPKLDGDFLKWPAGSVSLLNRREQIVQGERRWNTRFTARVALTWDEQYLYIGVDAAGAKIYQPFQGRGIDEGDTFILTLETAFRRNFEKTHADADEYRLIFSPGNFAGVPPSIFSDEDYLPPRPVLHHYEQEIRTAWMKTPEGYSGDIAIPVSYFDGGRFYSGYEIGLGYAVQKVLPPRRKGGEGRKIVFSSKRDHLFPGHFGNPSSYQRLVLAPIPKQVPELRP